MKIIPILESDRQAYRTDISSPTIYSDEGAGMYEEPKIKPIESYHYGIKHIADGPFNLDPIKKTAKMVVMGFRWADELEEGGWRCGYAIRMITRETPPEHVIEQYQQLAYDQAYEFAEELWKEDGEWDDEDEDDDYDDDDWETQTAGLDGFTK